MDAIDKIYQQTMIVPRLVVVFCSLIISLLMFGVLFRKHGSSLGVVNFIGFIYPAYMSFKSLHRFNRPDMKQWLTYWPLYTGLYLNECLLKWMPFYWFFKLALLAWCAANAPWNGSNYIYCNFVKPFMREKLND